MADLIPQTGKVLVDFYADWCRPCLVLGRVLEEIDTIEILKINIDDHPDLATSYGVRVIPTLMVVNEGKVAATRVGAMSKSQLTEWLNSVA